MPEYTSARVPSETSSKTALYNRVVSTTVTSNASGNFIFELHPHSILRDGSIAGASYYTIYNGADLNLNTGVQSATATYA